LFNYDGYDINIYNFMKSLATGETLIYNIAISTKVSLMRISNKILHLCLNIYLRLEEGRY